MLIKVQKIVLHVIDKWIIEMKKFNRKKFFELLGLTTIFSILISFFPFNVLKKFEKQKLNIRVKPNTDAVKRGTKAKYGRE